METLYSGVSRGTEALVAAGSVPASERGRMRCPFQAGDFPFPVKYGYSAVGRIVEGPPERRGRLAFVLHPHQTRFTVPLDAVTLLPLDVPPGRAVLAANLETALNALWDARLLPGDRVVVVGAGVVGSLIAWLAARVPGTEVVLVDRNPARAALAATLGAAFRATTDPARDGAGAAVAGHAEGADLVVEASGDPWALETCLATAAFEATVLVVGWYGAARAMLPLGEAFHSRRLRLVASQVSHVAPAQRSRWPPRRRLAKVVELLRDPVLDRLVTGESPFEALPDVLPRLLRDPGDELCHRIVYPGATGRGVP